MTNSLSTVYLNHKIFIFPDKIHWQKKRNKEQRKFVFCKEITVYKTKILKVRYLQKTSNLIFI